MRPTKEELSTPPGVITSMVSHEGTSLVHGGLTDHFYTDRLFGHTLYVSLHILYTRVVVLALILVCHIWFF